ncbi:MAG: FecR domain-containing protein [Bacteroidota bacterium]
MAVATSRIRDLIIKYLKEEITIDENQELMGWVHHSEENSALFHQLTDADFLEEALKESHELKVNIRMKVDQRIAAVADEARSTSTPTRSWRKIWYYAAAACLILVVGGIYFLLSRPSHPSLASSPTPVSKNDVAPGGNKAILTLANGSTIVLENAANGSLAVQGASRITKDKDLLAYNATGASPGNAAAPAVVYNTLTTPRAGQFQVVLPDGSKVWLNNASSLRYPTAFTGKSREVTLNGEAYFEIARDAAKPFVVRVNELAVNVLGTTFNIMAYNDEPLIKTTLLTGKISLAAGGKESFLSPAEQAVLSREGNWKILKGVDTDEAIAWQRGYFHFTHEDIEGVLRQLGRWYDVEVQFTIPVPDYTFDGEIGRDLSLSSILRHLEKKDLHFQIDGKKLIVSK